MADPQVQLGGSGSADQDDVEMQGGDDGAEVVDVGETVGEDAVEGDAAEEDKPAQRVTFVDYLKSPMIELLIGSGDDQTLLMAHKALLTKSPFFTQKLSSSDSKRIKLGEDDLDAMSCFLEYLYTGEYFPHKLSSGNLEVDPALPKVDESGAQLLKHAKVYTLAEKLEMPALKSLSHSKIHLINSTAPAELNYARYVYSHTNRDDHTIRKPVASFWGQRSHVLRHQTEGTFRQMCMDFPEFAFDVLSFVLDAEEKRAQRKGGGGPDEDVGRSARKRARGQ
ncbi:MAG: hypothetical protein L6R38_004165 [Xanthoria sp. 2 TBL-2021]|nr:MAG: hypothetical protein L6R38_004165 [Xanthoria sp. 2 TBL-2021]